MALGYRKLLGFAINLPSAGQYQSCFRVHLSTAFKQRQLTAAVDIQVNQRLLHALDMADLSSQAKDHFLIANHIRQTVKVANIRKVD